NRAITSRSSAATCDSSVTSVVKIADSPAACAAVSSSFALSRATSASFAPASPRASAIALPNPRLAPVIRAIFPVKVLFITLAIVRWTNGGISDEQDLDRNAFLFDVRHVARRFHVPGNHQDGRGAGQPRRAVHP